MKLGCSLLNWWLLHLWYNIDQTTLTLLYARIVPTLPVDVKITGRWYCIFRWTWASLCSTSIYSSPWSHTSMAVKRWNECSCFLKNMPWRRHHFLQYVFIAFQSHLQQLAHRHWVRFWYLFMVNKWTYFDSLACWSEKSDQDNLNQHGMQTNMLNDT